MSDGDLYFITDETDGKLGRNVVWHDPRNRQHPARDVLYAADAPITNRTWARKKPAFDQGNGSYCTAEGTTGLLWTAPFRQHFESSVRRAFDTENERRELYLRAQDCCDPWSGREPSYYGTSTDACLKALRAEGYIRAWKWNYGFDDTLRCLSNYSPVVIGINWKRDMMDTDHLGFIRYTGPLVGGHLVELYKNNADERYVVGFNSWSEHWGFRGGKFRMSYHDLRTALEDNGESATIVV